MKSEKQLMEDIKALKKAIKKLEDKMAGKKPQTLGDILDAVE